MISDLLSTLLNTEGLKYLLGEATPSENQNQMIDPSAFGVGGQSPFMPKDPNQGQGSDPGIAALTGNPNMSSGGASNPNAPTGAQKKESSNLMDTVTKFFSHPMVAAGVGALGAGLSSPYRTNPNQKWGRAALGGMEGFSSASTAQAQEQTRQQQLEYQRQQAAQQKAYQDTRSNQAQQQIDISKQASGIMSPDSIMKFKDQIAQSTDETLKRAATIVPQDSPTYAKDVLAARDHLAKTDAAESQFEQKMAHQQQLFEEKRKLEQAKFELSKEKYNAAAALAASEVERKLLQTNALIEKNTAQLGIEREKLENSKTQKYAESVAKFSNQPMLQIMEPTEREAAIKKYSESIGPKFGLTANPETGQPWNQKAPGGTGKVLDADSTAKIIDQAGGDRKKAAKIARDQGYLLPK